MLCPTSTGCCELSPAYKAKVTCSCPESLGSIAKAQTGVEMICLEGFIIINCVVTTGCVGTVHPDLGKG